jgi:hypothetical protein
MSAPTQWTGPGARRRHVTIQSQATTKTAMGFPGNGAWSDVLDTWASVVPVIKPVLMQVHASQEPIIMKTYRANIRYVASVTILPGMRLVEYDGGATYLIQQVEDVEERHRELNLFCSQVPAPAQQEQ